MWLILALMLVAVAQDASPARLTAGDLAAYRLTAPLFTQYRAAAAGVAAAVAADARYREAPLFTRDVVLSDDAGESAGALLRRLEADPRLAAAIMSAGLTPREFTTITLVLVGARLAHGFVESGAIRRLPAGAPAENVAFVGGHLDEVVDVLRLLDIEL